MATFMMLVALAALAVGLVYVGRKRWASAGIAGVIFVCALIVHAWLQPGTVQQQPNNAFPLPLNSGAGAAGNIPK